MEMSRVSKLHDEREAMNYSKNTNLMQQLE